MKHFDVIVIGVGSMGSAACYELATRGYRVLGIEQFSSPHTNGSHAGQSRIIRKAYFEHPDYVPLLERAYENWYRLEESTGEKVFHTTGLIYYGKPDHPVMKGVQHAASRHTIQLYANAANNNFELPSTFTSLFEPEAGFLQLEKSISLYKREALRNGAMIRDNEQVASWQKAGNMIGVITNRATYYSNKLVITAGAWANKIMPASPEKLKITRQLIAWVKPQDIEAFFPENFPCWLIADEQRDGALYGFPYLKGSDFGEPEGLKFAWHHPATETDPDHVDRIVSSHEIAELIKMTGEYIPAVRSATIMAAKTCLYANSADENFVIGQLPGYDDSVTIACGFSGHGFKFVSVVGEILADLATTGQTTLPIGFLRPDRFA